MNPRATAVRTALPSGTVLRGYAINSVLGHGGFGIVYLARHQELSSLVALKEYLPAELAVRDGDLVHPRSRACTEHYKDGLRRFLEEANQLIQFRQDPSVVSCLDLFRSNGTAYLVMEFVEGSSLAELLRQREAEESPLTEGELRALAVPLLEGLCRVHAAGGLHRDIKPSNILIRRDNQQPVLIDFGAAKQNVALNSKSFAPFTEGYAAMEQVGDGRLGTWTDVYAVGAVLWRIVAGGKPPWTPPNPTKVESRLNAKVRGVADPLPTARTLGAGRFSDSVLDAIDKCLELPEQDRVQDCAQLLRLLKATKREIRPLKAPTRVGEFESARGTNQATAEYSQDRRSRTVVPKLVFSLIGALVLGSATWLGLDRIRDTSTEKSSSQAETLLKQSPRPMTQPLTKALPSSPAPKGSRVSRASRRALEDKIASASVLDTGFDPLGGSELDTESKPEPPPKPTGPQKVRMVTNKGEMVLELYPERAPKTVENFLQYVDDKFYDGTIFHRVIPRFMVQGGGFTPNMQEKSTRAPIKNEAGSLSNLRYTIAMARTSAPHSATAQFFINHVTNRALDKDQARDGWGYCVFGKVIEGSEVVEAIAGVDTGTKAGHRDVPLTPVVIRSMQRVSQSFPRRTDIEKTSGRSPFLDKLTPSTSQSPLQIAGRTSATFTRGSHRDDVLRIQGTPSSINRFSDHEVWRYGLSTVDVSLRDGRVTEWFDSGDLKVRLDPGPNVTGAATFTRGSHRDDVLRIQGTPSSINRFSDHEVWRYGLSTVDVSLRDGRVTEWFDSGDLKVRLDPGPNVTGAATFTRGSHRDDVLRIQGTPSSINRFSDHEVWRYGLSTVDVSLRDGRVTEWFDSGDLKVRLDPGPNVTGAATFTRGSHRDDVLRIQGTPSSINRFSDHEVWRYGLSTVDVSLRDGRVTEWFNNGNLKVR